MPRVVIITVAGSIERDFANAVFRETGALKLVIVQKVKKKQLASRLLNFYRKVGLFGLARELFYVVCFVFSRKMRGAFGIFKERSRDAGAQKDFLAPTMTVDDINAPEVEEVLERVRPDVLVVWGGYIIKPHILRTAAKCVNVHFGVAPYYRGANTNAHAILSGDFKNIGATTHYMVPEVDAGDIIVVVKANPRLPLKEMFSDLNDRTFSTYLNIVKKLAAGEDLPGVAQDLARGKEFRLRDWTYEKRWRCVRMLFEWEKTGTPPLPK